MQTSDSFYQQISSYSDFSQFTGYAMAAKQMKAQMKAAQHG
jgi:hypothetical protein